MGWLQDFNNSISGFASNTQNSINDAVPALRNTGGYLTDAFKQNVPDDLQRTFWDQSRDNPINATMRGAEFSRGLAQGQNMFAGKDELEYKQNLAKRAAIVAAVFGGAAVGGAGAGANAAAGSTAAPAGTATTSLGGSGLAGMTSMPMATAEAAGTTAVPGTMAAMGETLGVAAPAATPGTTAAMASGAAVPGSAGLASTPAATAPAVASSGSWAPYATAGGTILSTLFSGLMQMEQQKEALKREKQMALAKSHVEKAQAENEALNRLIQVWQGARR